MKSAEPEPEILVTGATGFVGASLVEALLRKGRPIACLVRKTSALGELGKLPVRLIFGDLEHPGTDALRGIETVYHVAGAIKAASRGEYFRINQTGTRKLLETLLRSSPRLSRFVYVSSLAAAGPSPATGALTEEDPANPISWYGESKLKAETEVLRYAREVRVIIVRPSAVYGPRDRETLTLFRMIKHGCFLTPGRATRYFSLIHVGDLAAALIAAGEREIRSGEIFYLSRPEAHTWEGVGRCIADALGKDYRHWRFPAPLAVLAGIAGDLWTRISRTPSTVNSQKVKELLQCSWLCDSSKAQAILGFRPAIDLESGIRQTALWYRNHGWL